MRASVKLSRVPVLCVRACWVKSSQYPDRMLGPGLLDSLSVSQGLLQETGSWHQSGLDSLCSLTCPGNSHSVPAKGVELRSFWRRRWGDGFKGLEFRSTWKTPAKCILLVSTNQNKKLSGHAKQGMILQLIYLLFHFGHNIFLCNEKKRLGNTAHSWQYARGRVRPLQSPFECSELLQGPSLPHTHEGDHLCRNGTVGSQWPHWLARPPAALNSSKA